MLLLLTANQPTEAMRAGLAPAQTMECKTPLNAPARVMGHVNSDSQSSGRYQASYLITQTSTELCRGCAVGDANPEHTTACCSLGLQGRDRHAV